MKVVPTEKENQRSEHRNFASLFAGFSFSALLAIVVFQDTAKQSFPTTTYYLFISFIFYYCALNVQSYKGPRWQDQLGNVFMDTGSLSLILSIVSCMYRLQPFYMVYYILIFLGIAVWVVDHIIRLSIERAILKGG
ncbi:MAG: hypothetical protein P9M03_03025 [Candidatus Theseobacter exili]|nr:hypothetical protein [Candidatus Theseobacter exili]